ncbi:hypothetical protein EO244_16455 [Ancylomarina salipaludis]|uniref:Uncharacterized protein n=1 Tax=Ancylomarina salipaludis TaxID=2501299 RepID=A0A4Q1JIN6_9BACT|nr:hypothetical protein [Ancylomarina salipaludis]RXQ87398.1 hypothetical protein EO244_16455 [Ancylomarina salipaludis]
MIIKALFSGLISILTPVALIPLIYITIALGSVDLKKRTNSMLSLFFGVIFFLFSLLGLYITGYLPDITIDFNIFIFILSFIFGLWLLGVFDYFLPKVQNDILFTRLMVIISGIMLFGLVLSNFEPIIIALLESSPIQDFTTIFSSIIFFAIGFVIPTLLISLLLLRRVRKLRAKIWWKKAQLVIGILFLLQIIVSQIFW